MKRVYFTLALMSLFGGLNAFADVKQDGVVYEKMSDGQCFVVNYDEATMPEDGIVTIAATVNIDGVGYTVSGILGSGSILIIIMARPVKTTVVPLLIARK